MGLLASTYALNGIVHWHFDYRLCCVYCYLQNYHDTTQYIQQDSVDLTCFWIFVRKGLPFLVFEHQFWCHFHHDPPKISWFISLKKSLFCTIVKMSLLKSDKYILKHIVYCIMHEPFNRITSLCHWMLTLVV